MKHTLIALGITLVAACSSQEGTASTPSGTSGSNAAQPEGAGSDVDAAADVPTQDEADAAAAQSIDKQNADAEFEKLKNEIGGGG
ncbi:MAG: hypothetical protein L6Q99_22155 [Planctomycetes bacterium]|nr:hypothetical protein [Planctomycetota bacterium]